MTFEKLDVSAKTVDSHVMLNEVLLIEPYDVIKRYVIHEGTHAIQHIARENAKTDPYADDEYLDRGDEQEAFSNQFEFMLGTELEDKSLKEVLEEVDHKTKDEFVEYAETLMEHHDIPPKERVDKIEEIMQA
jgi:spore germination cell wall hydrolase CwlJ-like protein